ncbi:hypothetical protein [Helicobacter mustelae]|nr:hypothetical protein [Helicobacter mustelae]
MNEKEESLYLQYLLKEKSLVALIGEEAIKNCFEYSYYTKIQMKNLEK